jgi:hypothetical protein
MCTGISLGWSYVPTELKAGLKRRVFHRERRREVWFLYDDRDPRIPIRRDGQLQFVRWGNGRGQSRFLPRTGWTWQSTVDSGHWSHIGGLLVEIPATFALDRGVWVHVKQGIRGLLVPDEKGMAVCYVVCEASSHYYQIMTRNDRMPIFINQQY